MPIPQLKKVHSHPPKKSKAADSHRPTKLPEKPKLSRGQKIKNILKKTAKVGVILFIVFLIFGSAAFAWFAKDLPDPEKLLQRNLAQSTKILDRTGEHLLYEIHGDQKRTIIELEDIPQYVIDATITTEDRHFYEHHGFDVQGIFRTVFFNVVRGQKAGGSTITQQFVKNSILTPEKTYTRKIKELVLAFQLERKFTKDEILKFYLNEIPYGSNAYGIESAAQTYFGKSAKDLTLAEAATLAALPQRPTYYWNNQKILFGRKDFILQEMVDLGYISSKEAREAITQEIVFQPRRENITAPHFVFYVREQLVEEFGEQLVEQGGLRVLTTLDLSKQQIAEDVIQENMPNIESRGGDNAALVSLDTKTKQILAMVGSKDFFDTQNDGQVNVTTTLQSPGSSLKPFMYLTAFKVGYTPETMLFDLRTDFPIVNGVYTPKNYSGREYGPLSMRKALQGSLNIAAVKTLYLAGFDAVYDTLDAFGYTTFGKRPEFLSLALGGQDVKLLEHTYAYASLAREGVKHPLTSILEVKDKNGDLLKKWEASEGTRVYDQQAVQTLNNVLTDDGARSFIFGRGSKLTLPDRPVAVKTGSTQDNRDALTVGYTPSIATGVWVGTTDNSPMKPGSDGSVVAAPIWNAYMRKTLTGTPVEAFNKPKGDRPEKPILRGEVDELIRQKVDKITGKVIPDACLSTYPAEFVVEKEFKVTHTILHYVKKDDPRSSIPENPKTDPMYDAWEKEVAEWAKGQPGYFTGEFDYADCTLRSKDNQPEVRILKPADQSTVTPKTFEISIDAKAGKNRTLTKVEYKIDQVVVDTATTAPFTTSYQPTNLTFGSHTLTVTVTNDLSNTAIATSTFTYQESSGNPSQALLFLSPTNGETLSLTAAPFTIQLSLEDETVISLIEVFARPSGENGVVIASIENPSSKTPSVSWSPENAGTYDLYFNIHTANGIQTSDRITVTVENPVLNNQP